MKLEVILRLLKVLTHLFNIICLILGIFMLTAGAKSNYMLHEFQSTTGVFDILSGISISFIAILGSYAAISNSTNFHWSFTCLAFIIFITQISMLSTIDYSENWNELEKNLLDVWTHEPAIFNSTNVKFGCCELWGTIYEDYRTTLPSCVRYDNIKKEYYAINVACIDKIESFTETTFASLFVTRIVIIILEFLLLFFAAYMGYCYRGEKALELRYYNKNNVIRAENPRF